MKNMELQLDKNKKGKFFLRLRSGNYKIVLSGNKEEYVSRRNGTATANSIIEAGRQGRIKFVDLTK